MATPADQAQLLDAAHYRVMPWKNGQGTTREVALYPPGASLAAGDFLWRVSLAEVNADGDFSMFPGYDRTLVLVSGGGMELNFDQTSARARLTVPGASRRFSGDWLTHCRLIGGPVCDFNVMSARGKIEHRVELVTREAVEFVWEPAVETVLCYCLRGTLVLKMAGSGERHVEQDQSLLLPADPAATGRASAMVISHARDTMAVLVRLWQPR